MGWMVIVSVVISLGVTLKRVSLEDITDIGSHPIKPPEINPTNIEILPRTSPREYISTKDASEKEHTMFGIPVPDTIEENAKDKVIRSGQILGKYLTEYDPDVWRTVHPCVKPCVCSESPETHRFIVNCVDRYLSYIPSGIPTDVTHLFLGHNSISVIQSLSLEKLKHLEVLDISNNNLSQMETRAFSSLANLRHLSLNDNNLVLSNASFSPGIFRPLQNLTVLNLKSNKVNREAYFQYLDSEIGELSSLEELYIDGVSNTVFGSAYDKLPRLNVIDLSGSSSLEHLSQLTFSSLVNSPVSTLNISHCELRTIHNETFKFLTNIDTLDMSYNQHLELKNAGKSFAGLMNSTIRRIFAQRIHQRETLTILHKEDMKYLRFTPLEELYLDNNSIDQLEILNWPKTLRVLSISWNDLQTYRTQPYQFLFLRDLEFLYASYQDWSIGDLEMRSNSSGFQDLYSFLDSFPEIGNISDSGFITLSLPPNITEIYVSHTYKIHFSIQKMKVVAPKMKILDLSYSLLYRWEGPIIGLDKLEEFDLTGNICYEIVPGFFLQFKSLKDLKIGDNLLGPELEDGTFIGLDHLQMLNMYKNRMEIITAGLFSNLHDVRVLNLSSNYIATWESRISHMKKLTLLDLTSNKFSSLPNYLLNDLDRISNNANISISLKGNPLVCNCDTKYFIEWLMHTKVLLLQATSTYCELDHRNVSRLGGPELEATYNYLLLHCRTYAALIVVSGCITFVVLLTIVGKTLHRYRWKLRYLYYMARNTKDRTGYERLEGDVQAPLTFDAFISYEDGHRDFVRLEMLPRLETEAGLKLCIDKRDFIPGFYIADNIMNAIRNSRKTVVLLSRKFLESKWCMYEFNMARMESITSDRHSLLVVIMEAIPVNLFPTEVLEILHSKSYITKTDDPDGMTLFWRRLAAGVRLHETSDVAAI